MRALVSSLSHLTLPLLFVFLWSTGFIFTKYGLPSAPPMGFLTLRFAIAAGLLIFALPFVSVRWPSRPAEIFHSAIAGILIQAVYLGGVFSAISLGIGAGLAALLVGLQPLLTVILARLFLGETLSGRKLAGITVGLIGVVLVVIERSMEPGVISPMGLILCVAALFGISLGTIYQKRFCANLDLLPNVTIQYIASVIFLLPLAMMFDHKEIIWDVRFIQALAWLVLVLSIGAVFLLMWLIRQGEAGKVASLFYLVPPVVAIEAWILFDEPLTPLILIGVSLCIIGVAMVVRAPDQ